MNKNGGDKWTERRDRGQNQQEREWKVSSQLVSPFFPLDSQKKKKDCERKLRDKRKKSIYKELQEG